MKRPARLHQRHVERPAVERHEQRRVVEDVARARRASRARRPARSGRTGGRETPSSSNQPQPARNASVPAPPLRPVVSMSKNTTRRAQSACAASARIEQRRAARRRRARTTRRAGGRASRSGVPDAIDRRRTRSPSLDATTPPSARRRARLDVGAAVESGTYVSSRGRGLRRRARASPRPAGRCSRRRAARSRMVRSGRGSRGARAALQQARRHGLGQRPGRAFRPDARRAAGLARTAVDQLARPRDELRRASRTAAR